FTGVASVVGNPGTAVRVQQLRLLGLLANSLLGAAFSLLPLVLSALGFAGPLLWQIASAIFLVVWLGWSVHSLILARASAARGGAWWLYLPFVGVPNALLFVGVLPLATPPPTPSTAPLFY